MSKATHQVFKRIVLHNKLLTEPEVDALLAEIDDPEHAVQRLVDQHLLNAKAAEQFLALYKKQVDKLFLEELDVLDEPLAKPAVFSPQPEPAPQKEPPPEGKKPSGKAAVATETKPLPKAGIELLRQLLLEARDLGASDLHLKTGMVPAVRVHGGAAGFGVSAAVPGDLRNLAAGDPGRRAASRVCPEARLGFLL
jgi:hypothetical protein